MQFDSTGLQPGGYTEEVKKFLDADSSLGPAEKQKRVKNIDTVRMANNRRVDVTLRYQIEETLGNLIHKHFTTVHLRALPSSFRGATIQAADLMKDHTLVVPDLRGIGRSAKPEAAMTRKPRPKICAPL